MYITKQRLYGILWKKSLSCENYHVRDWRANTLKTAIEILQKTYCRKSEAVEKKQIKGFDDLIHKLKPLLVKMPQRVIYF